MCGSGNIPQHTYRIGRNLLVDISPGQQNHKLEIESLGDEENP